MFGPKIQGPYFFHSQAHPSQSAFMNPFINTNHLRQQPYPFYPQIMKGWQGAGGMAAPTPYLHPYAGNNHPIQQGDLPMQPPQNQPYQVPDHHYIGYNMPKYGQHMTLDNHSESLFHNPLAPVQDQYAAKTKQPLMPEPAYMNPYPKQSFLAKQPSGMQTLINSFKTQDGSIDVNKMMDTAGSMMNAVSQVSSMVKGIGGMFKA